ncbi:transcription antitermination factor NusB [Desulfofalx alkaliphila]|uniref:transcription antitermination factor NusB n=1 Tax=Desulfofalx alkaliphila TaxID=105483 RepID=UPI0004E1AA77|nr:transcription antitermination factor NusB [Desulfofalx alkaliphila]
MSRRQARETAVQVLFAMDLGKIEFEEAFNHVTDEFAISPRAKDFSKELIQGTIQKLPELDAIIKQLSRGWNFERLSYVDRNIMRLALYEIYHREEIPPAVSVNEAVELAKIYSGEEGGRFINGILGRVVASPEKFRRVQPPVGT